MGSGRPRTPRWFFPTPRWNALLFQKPPGDDSPPDDQQPQDPLAGDQLAGDFWPSGPPTDAQLLDRLRRQPEEGLHEIFKRDGAWLVAALSRDLGLLAYDDEIETAVSEALWVLYRDRRKLQIKSSLRGYLRKAALRLCLKSINKRFSERPLNLHDVKLDPPDQRDARRGGFATFLAAKVESLPPMERDLFRIDASQTRSAKSIAEELATSHEVIASLRYRRKKRIVDWLDEWDRRKEDESSD